MRKKGICNIKSLYILKDIFNYITDKQFADKLFLYSKKFQNKLDLKLIELKEKYLKKIDFNLDKYLYAHPKLFHKDYLTNQYNIFLEQNNLNKDKFEKIIYDIYEYKNIKDLNEEDINNAENYDKLIDIDSPLFNLLSKTKNFEKKFTVYLSQNNIDEYNLKYYYAQVFKNLNKLKIKYSSISYILDDITKLNYLNKINIDFNKIERINLYINNYIKSNAFANNKDLKINNKTFFETFFSINNFRNNLIYLKIYFLKEQKINSDLFKKINNFKFLKYLYLRSFNCDKKTIINLNNLEVLSLCRCNNLVVSNKKVQFLVLDNKQTYIDRFDIINYKEFNIFNLSYNNMYDIDILKNVDFKELKVLNLSNNKISDISILEKVRFKDLQELNLSNNEISDINSLKNVNFQKLNILNLSNNKISDITILEKVHFQKLNELKLRENKIYNINILEKVNFKELKELDLSANEISDIQILEKVNFNELHKLDLSVNQISDINILKKTNFQELKELNLRLNKISDINVFERVNFPKLNELNLSYNNISDIQILEKVNFKELINLNLSINNIKDINKLNKIKNSYNK